MKYHPIIGLEVHVELATRSKMFCGCPADHFGKEPNTQTCPVCLGLPGALPVPNKKAIDWTLMLAMALDCRINRVSKFDRKNYFYPDLPKGYQITQYDQPFGEWGKMTISGREIRIRRVHLEEDTGKLQHAAGETLIDFNRSGVPLVEIVTEPDFRSIEEVDIYLKKLQRLIHYLEISPADMERGSMRLEPSISLSPDGSLPKYRVELKNINSFRFVRKALEYEINRQTELLEKGESLRQETRGWSEPQNATFPQREKEEAHDYRYFPEPDIPPLKISDRQISEIKKTLPELPEEKTARFISQYRLNEYQANILCADKKTAEEFENQVKANKAFSPAEIANSLINKRPLAAKSAAAVNEDELSEIISSVLVQNPKAVADYRAGKIQVLGFFIGQVAKKMPDVDKGAIKNTLEKILNKY
jgi:aspartyl-tRNA(Asn)/glutamyl-tRNA(Gln) amidotransferase subunit B